MVSMIYVEESVADLPRSRAILQRFPKARVVPCQRYGEIFNPRAQSFRLQKKRPALILARKQGRLVLPTPEGYGIGGDRNFYFSHMLNCLYDCRYCFLQGMYSSAHYVLFVNYEDFFAAVEEEARDTTYFFSGYDCDSLAFEGVTGFVAEALPVFRALPDAWLELRTKSTRIEPLLAVEPWDRCVVAFSFTPEKISLELENGVPSFARRLSAMEKLGARGWPLGLRFDPLLLTEDFRAQYRDLFRRVFQTLDGYRIHSVTFGPFRLPAGFFRQMDRLYPDEPLLAGPMQLQDGMVSYRRELEQEMLEFCHRELANWVDASVFFPHEATGG